MSKKNVFSIYCLHNFGTESILEKNVILLAINMPNIEQIRSYKEKGSSSIPISYSFISSFYDIKDLNPHVFSILQNAYNTLLCFRVSFFASFGHL